MKYVKPHLQSDNIDFIKYGLLILRRHVNKVINTNNFELFDKDLINRLCEFLEFDDIVVIVL